MSDISDFVDSKIYPAVFEMADRIFPEFEFKLHGNQWISGNGHKIDGSKGEKHKVYIYRDRPYYLKDYTKGGKAITTYLQEQGRCSSWIAAVQYLANATGVSLPEQPLTQESIEKMEEKEQHLELLDTINDFFITSLLEDQSDEASKIREYLDRRGYNNYLAKSRDELHTNNKMELGYIPSRESLKAYLQSKGLDPSKTDTLFSQRLIGDTHKLAIPCRGHGRIVSFAFRTIKEDATNKYLYSSNIGEFKRFNLFNLKRPLNNNQVIIVVEGLFDALHAQARGIDNVVALGNASLTTGQIELIEKAGYEAITLCLDNDTAGTEGTLRAIKNIRETCPEIGVFVASLSDKPSIDGLNIKHDPDSFIRDKGIDAFQDKIKNAQYWFNWELDKVLNEIPTHPTDQDKHDAFTKIHNLGKRINDPKCIDIFIKRFAEGTPLEITPHAWQQSLDYLHKEIKEKNERSEFSKITNDARQTIDKAQGLFENGHKTEAIELLNNIGKHKNIGLQRLSYHSLFKPITRDDIKTTLEKESGAFDTGLLIHNTYLHLPSGALSFIAGRTGRGKTATLLNFAINGAKRQNGNPIVIFSYEENSRKLLMKLLNIYIGESFSENNRACIYNYYNQKNAQFKNNQSREKFILLEKEFFDELINTERLIIVDSNDYSDELINKIHYLHKNKQVGAVLIDYVQRLNLNNSTDRTSRHEELKIICNDLTTCAIDTGLPIILGAQFNRQTTDDKATFVLNNLGEGGSIERNASKVIAVNIEHNETPNHRSDFYIKVLKNRDGITEIFDMLEYNGNTGRISNKPIDLPQNSFSTKLNQSSSREYTEASNGY